ncbi:MFS transporter [Halobium salinum]|uniref:MFS transporter n=1 Tax=Halobium salinum TaxID=1364940 RepID=A0ABD5P8Z1_9EURY|nr:MFS transporter [Halobium salinum]
MSTRLNPDSLRARVVGLDALLLTSLLWLLAKFLRYLFPPLFATLQESYGVSNATVGAAFTGLMLAYAAMQFPSGALADRVGSVRVVVAGALVAAAGAAVVAVAGPFPVLVGGMLLVGLGTGAHKTVAIGLLSKVYPARTGRALGVLDTLGAFGGVVAPAAVVVVGVGAGTGLVAAAGLGSVLGGVAAGYDWRSVFLVGAGAGVLLAGLFAWRVPGRVEGEDERGGTGTLALGTYAPLFRERRFLLFVLVTVLFSIAYNGAVAFLPLYLTRAVGLSPSVANLVYAALFLVSLVQTVTGDLSDRVGKLPMIVATLSLSAAGLGASLVVRDPLVVAAVVVLFGVGSHGFRPVRGAYLTDVIPDDVAGGTLGIVRTLLMGAGALAPAVVGVVSDAVDFGAAFSLLFVAIAGAAAVAALLLVRPRERSRRGPSS